jgi:hypothetical protein
MKNAGSLQKSTLLYVSILCVFTTGIFTSCVSSPHREFEAALNDQRCEEALAKIPENDSRIKFLGRSERVAGNAFSYAATGLGYVADVMVTVTGGVAILTISCGPSIAISLAAHSATGVPCLWPDELTKLLPTEFGHATFQSTESWRCPDLSAFSGSIRRVAECQSSSGTISGLERAMTSLNTLGDNDQIMDCVDSNERKNVYEALEKTRSELSRISKANFIK